MEFSIVCPNDGDVEVGLDNIASIVVRGDEDIEVVFICPRCGHHIHVSAQVPRMLLATLADTISVDEETGEATLSVAALMERGRMMAEGGARLVTWAQTAEQVETPPEPETPDEKIDGYCEYFRRQLASVTSVEAMLAEIDAR